MPITYYTQSKNEFLHLVVLLVSQNDAHNGNITIDYHTGNRKTTQIKFLLLLQQP